MVNVSYLPIWPYGIRSKEYDAVLLLQRVNSGNDLGIDIVVVMEITIFV